MNLDFHYYGTYCAARLAGYAKTEARKIAYYAQFVDECTKTVLEKKGINQGKLGFVPQPTVQSNGEIFAYVKNPKAFSKEEIEDIMHIWSSFHFLPGNTVYEVPYNGPQQQSGVMDKWEYNKEEEHFKLLCLPNSDLVVELVENARKTAETETIIETPAYALEMIGMTMHVLADTWAHCWFAGIPAWFMNDVLGDVYELITTQAGRQKMKLKFSNDPFPDNISGYSYSNLPGAPRFNGTMYLGHGRMGHLPDYSFMCYQYQPVWEAGDDLKNLPEQGTRIKDNQKWFMKAFCQMVYALECIRLNRPFEADKYANIDNNLKRELEKLFAARKLDTCDEWKKIIAENDTLKDSELEKFQVDKAFTDYDSAAIKKKTSLYRFLKAASEHVEFIKQNIVI